LIASRKQVNNLRNSQKTINQKNCNPTTQNYSRILKIIQQVLSPLNWRTIEKKLRYFNQKLASQYLAKKIRINSKMHEKLSVIFKSLTHIRQLNISQTVNYFFPSVFFSQLFWA
jgi:hypothetical protein